MGVSDDGRQRAVAAAARYALEMALIRSLTQVAGTSRRHPTEVDAEWSILDLSPGKVLQISTFGSDERKLAPKVSQTFQLDRGTAMQLRLAIDAVFPSD